MTDSRSFEDVYKVQSERIANIGRELKAERERAEKAEAELAALRERLAQPTESHKANQELLEALSDVAYGLESARIWGGMDWSYNPLHPFKYLPLRDKARAAIDKFEEKNK